MSWRFVPNFQQKQITFLNIKHFVQIHEKKCVIFTLFKLLFIIIVFTCITHWKWTFMESGNLKACHPIENFVKSLSLNYSCVGGPGQ